MIFLFPLFFFCFGLVFGSFLNVLIYRLPNSLPLTGRSFCPKCKKKISWYDNLPLLSFLVLGGRCRHCHFPISWQYPFVELVTGVLTVLSIKYLVLSRQDLILTTYYLILIYALIVIFFIDLYHEIIPDEIVYPAIIITLIFSLYPNILISNLISGFLAGLLFLILFLLTSGRGMGFGDFKLAVLMGLFLGKKKII
ncbi:prepilin peptidase, partial [Patescibacteria group bacterium]|nr:prepilin peptidase [Patescibacteria group bacterium]